MIGDENEPTVEETEAEHPVAQVAAEDPQEGDEEQQSMLAWRKQVQEPSLPETFDTVEIAPENAPWWRKLRSFTGLGFVIAVGYMDPGNWATDVAGGASFGYDLLVAILCSSLAAMVLQFLSIKLGVATGRDLAQACRDAFHPKVVILLWIIMEIAMVATDMAELLGAAIALYLLLGVPLAAGVVIMGVDVLFILMMQQTRLRLLEAFIMILTLTIFTLLLAVVIMTNPNWGDVFYGFVPKANLFTNSQQLFLAVGILGATVMPHNLFLHSALIQSRKYPRTVSGRKYAIKYGTIDNIISLSLAFLVNASILIASAAAFHGAYSDTDDIFQAYDRLALAVGSKVPSILFAVALLASGQQASLTGTLAGQVVMEGMLQIHIAPWKRRLGTRLIAMLPTIIVTSVMGENSIVLLIISQVTLSMALSFATFPLLYFTSSERKMGKQYVNSLCTKITGGVVVFFIAGLNIYLISLPSTWQLN